MWYLRQFSDDEIMLTVPFNLLKLNFSEHKQHCYISIVPN